MSETQPNPNDLDPSRETNEPDALHPSEPLKRPRRRRWPWVILAILLVLVGLVVLAPTIASTGPVRSFVVAKINDNLNGRVAIDDWSLGWFSGIRLTDLKVYDEQNAQIAHVPRLTTDLTLVQAVRGDYKLGNTRIDVASFVARVDENGRTNFDKLVKEADPRKTSTPSGERDSGATDLPDVSGNILVNIDQGTVETPDAPPVHVGKSSVGLNITDVNGAIQNDVKLAFRVGDQTPGTLSAVGTLDVAENNRLQIDQLAADQKVSLSNVNLAAAAPFVQGVQLGGVGNGSLDIKAQGITGISAAGEIVVDNFLAGGDVLSGDVFRTSRLAVPVQVTRSAGEGGATLIKIERLGLEMPEATVRVVGQFPEQALLNLIARKAPGAKGDAQVNVDVPNIAAIANQLPNTLKLQEGVQLTGGRLAQVSNVVMNPDSVNLAQTLDLTAEGTNAGRPVRLSPIHLETIVTAVPTGEAVPNLRDLKLALTSAFATVTGGAESLAAVKVGGNFDLDKLRSELSQFVDLGEVQLAGRGDFEVATTGDPTDQSQPIAANAKLNLTNLTVAGVGGAQPVRQDRLALVASGNVTRTNGSPSMLEKGYVALTSGDPAAPLIDLQANANVDLKANTVPWFELTKLNVTDLAKAQAQFGGFVPALAEQKINVTQGQLYANVAGSFDGTTVTLAKPMAVSMPNLTLTKDGRPVVTRETIRAHVNGTVSLPDDGSIAGNFTDLSVTTQSNLLSLKKAGDGPLVFSMDKSGAPRGSGQVALAADLKRLNDVAQNFGGQVVAQGQPQLRSGLFDGTLTLAKAEQPQTVIDFSGELTQVTVSGTQGNALENEKVTIVLKAAVPDDLKGTDAVTADGQINSTFAQTKLIDVRVLPGAGTWDMVQSAKVNATIPDLPKLYALINALSQPAAAAPQQAAAARAQAGAAALVSFMQVRGDEPIGSPRGDEPISRPRRPAPEPRRAPAPAPKPTDAPDEPAAPLEVTGGAASLSLDVKRDTNAKKTSINLTDARVTNLALRRGTRAYQFDPQSPIALKLAADVNAADAPGKSLVQQIQSINVSELSGDLRVARLSMPRAIVLKDLGAETPSANGGVRVEGELRDVTPLLAVLQGAEPMPYAGAFVLTQNVSSQGQQVNLDGEVLATKFQVLDRTDPQQVVFAEDRLAVTNSISADPSKKVAQIKALNVDMATSGALKIGVTGTVQDWGGAAPDAPLVAVQNLVADVGYDLEKIWPIVKPLVATAEDPMDEVAVVGKHQKKFTVNGPYYKGEMHAALRQLQVVGDLTVDRFVYPGIELQNVQVPIYLRRGIAQIEYAGRPAKERIPPPAAFNGGTLSIGGIALDLTQPDPRLSIPNKYHLVSRASINPLLGDTLGKYVNPIFPNSKQAKGLLDVTMVYCENVALGEKLKSQGSGRAQVIFSLRDMDIANPTGSLLFGAIPGVSFGEGQADTFRGQIRQAVVTLENGVITEDITLELTDPGKAADVIGSRQPAPEPIAMPLRFQGNVNLSDLRQNINVSVPTGLLAQFFRSDKDREVFAKIFPEGVPLTLTGTTVKPRVDAGNIGQKIIEGQLKGLIDPSKEGGAGSLLEDLLNRDRNKEKDRDRNQNR